MLINHNPFFNHSKVFRSSSGRVFSVLVLVCVSPAGAVAASSFVCAHVFLFFVSFCSGIVCFCVSKMLPLAAK